MTIMASKLIETKESDESDVEIQDNSGAEASTGESNESSNEEDNGTTSVNPGWADSIAKILKTNKPKRKKTLVLSKAKKLTDIKPAEKSQPIGFEIATADGEVKEEKVDISKVELKSEEPPRKKKRELPNLRVKPNILQKDRERTLTKIANRGVVQLFNAVRTQQKDISNKLKEAGPLEVHKEKVMKSIDKRQFLDVLMGEKSEIVEDVAQKEEIKSDNPTWSVLRDDFMMGAKLKDWDKELDEEQEEEVA